MQIHLHVEDRNGARSGSRYKFFTRHWLKVVSFNEITADDSHNLSNISFCNAAQRGQKFENGIIGKPIVNEFAVTPIGHQAGVPHVLEMLRGVGNRQARPIRKHLNAALSLGKLLQQLEAVGMP
jgi:hypothetical protein